MRKTLLAALAIAILPGCMVESRYYEDRSLPPPHSPPDRQPLSRWGESCRMDTQCVGGHVCLDGSCEPSRIGIYPVNALVAPGKADGREWDADRYLPLWVWDELDSVRRRGTVDELYAFMADQRRMGWSAPDPYGYGFLSTDGYRYDDRYTIALGERGRQALDVFDVSWPATGWSQVPFTTRLSVGLDFYDEDRRNDEAIGFVELDFAALRDALYLGGVVYFDAYEQTDGQLLLVGVEVVPDI